jgi:hypothetical protein
VRIWGADGNGTGSAYEFAEVGAVQVLEDVEEAVDEEGVVLDELVVLGDLAGDEEPQLRVDRLVPLHYGLPRERCGHPELRARALRR